jgi:pimeloyl-ACP methyl ester carboxylesterase
MSEHKATNIGPSGLNIVYENFGDPDHPPVILIMGLAAQMIHWPDELCKALADEGLYVVRFDNRDAGHSSYITNGPVPDFPAALAGNTSSASYTLSDMASDTVGLIGALGLESAHVVGTSMGGFIAQTIAIEHPSRIRSLTSIMATTGNPAVGKTAPDIMKILFASEPPRSRQEAVSSAIEGIRLIGSPDFPRDENEFGERAGRAYDRAHDHEALLRQGVAVFASGDRTEKLKSVTTPTLVIHGERDQMCDVSGGIATAEAIKGSQLSIIEGMGHDLPRALWPRFVSLIVEHIRAAEAGWIRKDIKFQKSGWKISKSGCNPLQGELQDQHILAGLELLDGVAQRDGFEDKWAKNFQEVKNYRDFCVELSLFFCKL